VRNIDSEKLAPRPHYRLRTTYSPVQALSSLSQTGSFSSLRCSPN
jgi:hypothetical protein